MKIESPSSGAAGSALCIQLNLIDWAFNITKGLKGCVGGLRQRPTGFGELVRVW